MRLKNKKTGEVGEAYWATFRERGTDLCISMHTNGAYEEVHSLAELNEEWEDYKPKEPLLKNYPNEMDAIRAYGCSPLRFHRHARKGYSSFNFCTRFICFNGLFENLEDGEIYSIAELCGDSKEDE